MSAEISSPRVLIIEDESTIARFIAAALQDEGFTTFIEGTMKGGLAAAFTRQPDILIVDLGLPDGDGLDLIGAVRAKTALPMIVLSARTDEKQKIQALDLGADDYLVIALRHGRAYGPRACAASPSGARSTRESEHGC